MADLYPYLILIGFSIIVATTWLLSQARHRASITNELVALNEELNFDLPDFLRHCWKPLSKAGFRGISWQLDWFGSKISQLEGVEGDVFIERKLQIDDISLVVHLYDGKRRFEQRYFSRLVSESFFLLLYTDMWVKLGTVQGAFAQSAKMSVFLQHDMKNIVQLVSLMAEQLETTPEGKQDKLLESLRTVMPTLRERSERFLSTLSSAPPTSDDLKAINLCDFLHKTAEIHDLFITIEGEGSVQANEESLSSVFDNLFGNYIDETRRNPGSPPNIEVSIDSEGASVEIALTDKLGKPCLWPERLFEPFWSEKGDGLGIGLYHARQLVTGLGGTLQASTPADAPMTFVVSLPNSL
ncbi:MAG: HAMP domain-containing histidine kinase [Pseudomonadales bacterium]|nr:HAMP domain-containing histidine kinase [Pseudomonadales bacterium]